MTRNSTVAIVVLIALGGFDATRATLAAEVPRASVDDTRIRVVTYQPKNVTKIFVRRGVVTRIILGQDERIEMSAIGLSSDCKAAADEWCISAEAGGNQIFVRPRDAAHFNNIEVRTNKRDYSMEFEVIADSRAALQSGARSSNIPAFYRVMFEYPVPKPPLVGLAPERQEAITNLARSLVGAASATALAANGVQKPAERLNDEPIGAVRNADYAKQVLLNGADAEPSAVFDDGRFTYFEFVGAREIPAIFAHGSDGEPVRVNWHMEPPFVVVQRTARKFTLRLGGAVVGIFNNAYDVAGTAMPTSTVSDEVQRTIKPDAPR
jgi:type IV secretion system protein VirB9